MGHPVSSSPTETPHRDGESGWGIGVCSGGGYIWPASVLLMKAATLSWSLCSEGGLT